MKQNFLNFCSRMLLMLAVLLPASVWADELTVNNGTTTNQYVPLYSFYADTRGSRSQFVQSSATLEELTPGSVINSLTFYASYASKNHAGDWKVTLLEGVSSPLSGFAPITSGTLVYQGAMSVSANKLTITFTTPYVYQGGDLLVDISMVTTGSCGSSSDVYYGVSAPSGSSYRVYGSSGTPAAVSFLPKMTISYEPAATGSCARPGAITASNITDVAATLSWEAAEGVSQYQYCLVDAGADVDWTAAMLTSATSANVSGLSASSNYDFYVRSYCGAGEDEQSTARKLGFKTACGVITAASWFEDFDTDFSNDCWIFPTSGVSVATSDYAYEGSKAIKFATTDNVVVVLPDFGALQGKRMRFYYRSEGEGATTTMGEVAAGYITDPANPNTSFVQLANFPKVFEPSFMEVQFTDPAIPASARPAFYYHDATSAYWYAFVDNVTISAIPSCVAPSNIRVVDSLSTTTSATIQWHPFDAANLNAHIVISKGTDVIVDEVVSDSVYVLSGLNSGTAYSYKVSVNTVCGGVDSEDNTEKTVSFQTVCAAISSLPWSLDFEDMANGSGKLPPCWTRGDDSNYPYVYNNTSSSHSGSQCLYFYGGGSSPRMVVLPELDAALDVTNMRIKFFYRYSSTGSSYGKLIVGAMSDPSDLTTFVGLDTLDQTSSYKEYELWLTEFPADCHYIALQFAGGTSAYGTIYLDDLSLSEIPSCRPAKDLHFAESDLESATFEWTPANGEEEWQIQYKLASADPFTTETVTEPSFTIEGLEPATAYTATIILHSLCDGDLSEDSVKYSISFATACEFIDLEMAENDSIIFDGEDGLTPCFYQFPVSGTSTSAWASDTYNHHSGAKSYYIYGYSKTDDARALAFPQIMYGDDKQLSFFAKASAVNAANKVDVYVSENRTSLEGAISLGSLDLTSEWKVFVAPMPEDLAWVECYIILVAHNYSNIYVDDVVVTSIPQCQAVLNIQQDSLLQVTDDKFAVYFSWTRGAEEENWNVYYSIKAGSADEAWPFDETDMDAAEDSVYVIANLEPNTKYVIDLYVAADCGDATSAVEHKSFTFTTPCVAYTELPWSEDFNSLAEPYSIPSCWDKSEGTTTNNSYKWGMATTGVNSTKCVGFESYYNASGNTNFLKTPIFDVEEDVRFSFKWCNPTGGDLSVYYTLDGGEPVLLKSGMKNNSSWTEEFFDIPESAGHVLQFVFKGTSNCGSTNQLIRIDDVALNVQPSCVRVRNLNVADITTTSAKIQWTPGKNETEWSVVIKQGTTVLFKDTIDVPYVLINTLAPGHAYTYNVLVKAMCDGAEAEDFLPAADLTFATECVTIASFPWSESFEAYASGSVNDIPCWETNWFDGEGYNTNTSTKPWAVYSSASSAYSGSKSLYAMYTGSKSLAQVILPLMDIPAANAYEFLFMANRPTGTSYLTDEVRVFVNSTPDTIGATRLLGVHRVVTEAPAETEGSKYYQYSVTIPNAGEQYIVLQYYSRNGLGMYFDDFQVREIPTCFPGTNLHVIDSLASLTSVSFGWTPYSEDNLNAHVIVKNGNDTVADAVVADSVYTITGLNNSSVYNFSVQVYTVCGETESTDALAGSLKFTTECAALASLPWAETFEAQSTSEMPLCWGKLLVGNTNDHSYPYVYGYSAYEGSKDLYTYAGSAYYGEEYIILPEFDESVALSDAILKFFFKAGYTSDSYAKPVVGSMSDPSDATTFVALQTLDLVSAYTEVELYLNAVPADHHYLAIYIPVASSSTYYYFDNFLVKAQPSCKKPANLELVAAGESDATFSWTPNGDESEWIVKCYDAQNALQDSVAVSSATYAINGLLGNTKYTFTISVQASCGADEFSEALVKTFTFKTAVPASYTETLAANGTFEADFSDAEEQAKWIIDGAGPNQFTFGTAAAACHNGAPAALYVSDNTTTKAYNYTTNSASTSVAYRMFELPDVDSIRIEFDWLANGEFNSYSKYDYGRVFFAPASFVVEATTSAIKLNNTQVAPGSSSYTNVPDGAIDVFEAMFGQTNAQSVEALTAAEEGYQVPGGLYNLFFFWGNDTSSGTQYPLSICNVKITTYTAEGPATSIEEINTENGAEKFLYEGNVYIRHNGIIYNVTGQRVSLR